MIRRAVLFACFALLAACNDPATPPVDGAVALDATALDAGPLDAGSEPDAGPLDAGRDASTLDAGTDAGPVDAGPPVEGTISGSCDEIDTELLDPMAFRFENEITFPVRLMESDLEHFQEGTRQVLSDGTVGGSSVYSEAMSFEVLARCEGATLLASEPFIRYMDESGTRTDLLVEIEGSRVGVSVTRAVHFPRADPYPLSEAQRLLMRKLEDIQESTANVDARDRWVKQILHVMAYAPMHADMFRMAWEMTPVEMRGDTILLVTVTNGEDEFIYDNEL